MEWYKKLSTLLILAMVVGLTGCASPAKKTMSDQTYAYIIDTSEAIQYEDWTRANNDISALKNAWKKIKPGFQLNQSTATIDEFESSMMRLEGYVLNQDKSSAQAEINLLMNNWKQLRSY